MFLCIYHVFVCAFNQANKESNILNGNSTLTQCVKTYGLCVYVSTLRFNSVMKVNLTPKDN